MRHPLRSLLALTLVLFATADLATAQRRGGGGGGRSGSGAPPGFPPGVFPPAGGGAKGGGKTQKAPTFGGTLPPLIYSREPVPPTPLVVPDEAARTADGPQGRPILLGNLPELHDLQLEYFRIADYDEDGWISFREAAASMDADRGEFRSFDNDRDGRIQPEEFGERLKETVQLIGSFRPPRPMRTPTSSTAAEESATEALVKGADVDRDGRLTAYELGAVFNAFGVEDVDAELVLSSYDRDLSGNLDPDELGDIASALREGNLAIAPAPLAPPESIDDLFGVPIPRKKLPNGSAPSLPPRLVGPVTHFHRLDADRNGTISAEDLTAIQTPLQLDVRARAIVAFLDTDGDGELTPAELRSAFE